MDGCLATSIACNGTVRGRLSAADCARPDGTSYDVLYFNGVPGQYVTAVVYPLSPSLTNPTIAFVPPQTVALTPPVVQGGKGGAISYALPTGGLWALAVGTRDPGASGDYVVALSCSAASALELEWYCIKQFILCGQTASWQLSPQSCYFSDSYNRYFARFRIHGIAGDILSVDLESNDFNPRFGIYYPSGGVSPLVRSTAITPTKDSLSWALPFTGIYDILATSDDDFNWGRFTLTVNACASAGCLPPLLLKEPADVDVPYGTKAALTATAIGAGALRYDWYDRSSFPSLVAVGPKFATPPITAPAWYSVSVVTPCGTAESRLVTVKPSGTRR